VRFSPVRTVAALALVSVAACSRPGSDDAFKWVEELGPGAVLHIRDGAGDIVVRRAEGQTATITGSRRWKRSRAKDVKFVVTRSGNDYYVCAMWRASGKCGNGKYNGRQTNTFLSMFSLFHRSSDASADFVAEVPANVVVDARTTIGTVEVDGMASGVTAQSTSGGVNAINVSGPLSLSTTNGDVRLVTDSLSPSGTIDLSTRRGRILAELPQNVEGTFDLSVMSGSIRNDLGLTQAPRSRTGRHFQGQIGSSTRSVKMRVGTGSVSVVTRSAPSTH
jgi:DUF4097 and DUF4098 domain-containing protein YvlB